MIATKLLCGVLICFCLVGGSEAWRGNTCTRTVRYGYWQYYCACWYRWWGCSYYRRWWRTSYRQETFCCPGWRHNGDRNCDIPICSPMCLNGGDCVNPNTCDCPTTHQGPICSTAVCSYATPCYPGACYNNNECDCDDGFSNTDRCIKFENSTTRSMYPYIQMSTATLAHIRRFDNQTKYEFVMDATEYDGTEVIWSNQRIFNTLSFSFRSVFETPEPLTFRPVYVHSSKFGVVSNKVNYVVSSIPRDNSDDRFIALDKTEACSGVSWQYPTEDYHCNITDDDFKTLIEHGDWLTVTFSAESGGFRRMTNLDTQTLLASEPFTGLTTEKKVRFKFDFDAPKHCSERDPSNPLPQFNGCSSEPQPPLIVAEEFTKQPIEVSWGDWTDELSGVLEYYVEVFTLKPDQYGNLIEETPVNPLFSDTMAHPATSAGPFTPSEPGMYSVLLEARDMGNNSKIARRLVLYDPVSNISMKQEGNRMLYVSSAVGETGYMWQTSANHQSEITISVKWTNHFINEIHDEGKLLNKVEPYPIQFQDIQEDGILYSEKFVFMDDDEGKRTVEGISNFRGIVKFETQKVYTDDTSEPQTWNELPTLEDTMTFTEQISDGGHVRVWVRATDIMGNQAVDSTVVYFDTSEPTISPITSPQTAMTINFPTGLYDYTTRFTFDARDDDSGVHKIGFSIFIVKEGEQEDSVPVYYTNHTKAHVVEVNPDPSDPRCNDVMGKCFYVDQTLDVDNCWFMVDKNELTTSNAYVDVSVYNQALLTATIRFKVDKINELKGLEEYSGPSNLRVLQNYPYAVRIGWDLPKKASCYGQAAIIIFIDLDVNDTLRRDLTPESIDFDIINLKPDTTYTMRLGMQFSKDQIGGIQEFTFTTAKEEEAVVPISGGIIAGIVTSVVVVIVLLIAIFVVLLRRGHMQPVRRRLDAMSVKYRNRKSLFEEKAAATGGGVSNKAYDNRPITSADDMYIYGGMDFDTAQSWHLSRSDVSFETLIKSGHFANIYKAKLKRNGRRETVVAKTLKEGYTKDDEMLMMAKINFSGTKVGSHPNVLAFFGAVIEDTGVGPFIVYEYCENGNLRDYLVAHKDNVTIELQENLFRFGLDIAKGMDYLTDQGIVHRRLAARNMLLTFLNEVKIAGFGPLPVEQAGDGDAESGKKERIPVKWMPPECMDSTKDANEKSDVWSYGVVLWEIFSLGDQPYGNIRSRELPSVLKKGGKLNKPEQCDDTWYGVMQRTWNLKPGKRPTFKQIREELDAMFVQASGDENYYYSRK